MEVIQSWTFLQDFLLDIYPAIVSCYYYYLRDEDASGG